jgi:hypothetical protein
MTEGSATTHKSIEFQIMTMLNHAGRQGKGGMFDCGKYGICQLSWTGSTWNAEWPNVEKFKPVIVERET